MQLIALTITSNQWLTVFQPPTIKPPSKTYLANVMRQQLRDGNLPFGVASRRVIFELPDHPEFLLAMPYYEDNKENRLQLKTAELNYITWSFALPNWPKPKSILIVLPNGIWQPFINDPHGNWNFGQASGYFYDKKFAHLPKKIGGSGLKSIELAQQLPALIYRKK